MAYRGGAGVWIAIGLLFLLTAAFSSLWFSRESAIMDLENALKESTLDNLRTKYKNKHAEKAITQKVELDNEIETLKNELQSAKELASQKEAELQTERARTKARETENTTLLAQIEQANNRVKELEAAMNELRQTREQRLEARITELTALYEKEQERAENLNKEIERAQEREQSLRAIFQKRLSDQEREITGLEGSLAKWQKESGRQAMLLDEIKDGQILEADPEHKVVVINLGHAHRVHTGMRFDVIRWRFNRWDTMGVIELTEVNETTSTGVIMDAIVKQKVCPLTGYVARDPEEKFSPFAAGGTNNTQVVELVPIDTVEKPSMDPMDPIVKGDFITNPFYSQERTLRYVIAGDPVSFSKTEVAKMIEKHGGIVQESVDVDTDYVVIGKIADANAASFSQQAKENREAALLAKTTAEKFGIPLMREVELFAFLRK